MRKIRHLTMMLLLVSTLGMVLNAKPVQASPSVVHFSHLLWTPMIVGSGPVIHHTHFVIPASSGGIFDYFAARLNSACKLRGDFAIQVSFKLGVWPSSNGVRVGLNAMGFIMTRYSTASANDPYIQPAGEHYVLVTPGGGSFQPFTSGLSGKLRLARVGSELMGSYFDGISWATPYGGFVGGVPTGDADFSMIVWSGDTYFAHEAVKVSFSDFIISSGTLVCP